MKLRYTVVVVPGDEDGFVATVPALPGCVTQGRTLDQTLERIKDAIRGYLEVTQAQGESIPVEAEPPTLTQVEVEVESIAA